jgi:thiamine kinase-like enzyme
MPAAKCSLYRKNTSCKFICASGTYHLCIDVRFILPVCELTIEFWREALQAPVTAFEATVIKEGFWPTTVYRVRLESSNASTPRSLILKCAGPHWQNDPYGAERELNVYTQLLPHIPIRQPALYFAIPGDGQHHTQIAMQDLDDAFVFYPETQAWTWTEAQAIVRTLARLHIAAESLCVTERPYLMPPLRQRWTPARAREMFADLLNTSWLNERLARVASCVDLVLGELPRLEQIAANEPFTLVHYDVYPPNVAFPRDMSQSEAVLIDWALASADIAEIDLAFVFQQPYKSDRLLDWRSALRYYWDEREQLTGDPYVWQERCAIFRYARIQTVFTTLVPIHRAWEKAVRESSIIGPDSPDPYMRFYDATLKDVADTLQELIEDNGT